MQPNLPNNLSSINNGESQKDKNIKNIKTFKIIAIVASIIALCGIIFGVYCAVQNHYKDEQIADLKTQISNNNTEGIIQNPEEQESENNDTTNSDSFSIENLHLIGDIYTKRKYYLGITDLDPSQDTRDKEVYIIDTTKLDSEGGIKKYDLKTILDQAESSRIASLPDILAEGTTNATPKSDCQSYKVVAGDPTDSPSSMDWTIATDWSDALPLTIYVACAMKNGGELSLGTGLYSLNPSTNELKLLTDRFY